MYPVLYELPVPGGTRPIGSYGVLFALALLVGGALFVRRAVRAHLDPGRVVAALAVGIGGALAGAWLLFVVVEAVRTGDLLVAVTTGGRVFLGGLLGGIGAFVVAARRLRLPVAWDGSTMIGRWDSSLISGATARSRVLRVAVS